MNKKTDVIWILLDNKSNQFDSIASAAALARQMKSRLQGLFIEDDDLLRAAELPFAQEISLFSAQERQITSETMHRTLRAYAGHIKKQLEKIALQEHIEWSFKTIRGERMRWIMESRITSDILFIGGAGHAHEHQQQAYSKHHKWNKDPLQVLFSGSQPSINAVRIALRIAEQNQRPLVIQILVDDVAHEAILRNEIATMIYHLPATPVNIVANHATQIQTTLQNLQAHMLILPNDIKWMQEENHLRNLLQWIRCPVIFVR